MRILLDMGRVWEAERLIDVTSAHIDSCLYHGPAGLDFAELLLGRRRARRHPDHPQRLLARSAPSRARPARRRDVDAGADVDGCLRRHGLQAHVDVRPYQLERRPAFGEHVAWAESNAIVFANSVLGARTNRYGDFIDICAAITGRVPAAGLHLDEQRRGSVVFRLADDVRSACSMTGIDAHMPSATSWGRARHRRARHRGPATGRGEDRLEGARRRRRVVRRRLDVPRRGSHARGAHAGRRAGRDAGRTRVPHHPRRSARGS